MPDCCFQATVEIDELAKFASEAGEKMKTLEPVTSDADAIVEQLHDYKVCSVNNIVTAAFLGQCYLQYTNCLSLCLYLLSVHFYVFIFDMGLDSTTN